MNSLQTMISIKYMSSNWRNSWVWRPVNPLWKYLGNTSKQRKEYDKHLKGEINLQNGEKENNEYSMKIS